MAASDGKARSDGLRTEIVESQKTQADFLKWKLISVGAVAAISLGFTPTGGPAVEGAKYLICLVPLICAYVDLINLHIMIRILVIGIYLKKAGDPYETFVFGIRDKTAANPFVFEVAAMFGSSAICHAIVLALGFALPGGGNWPLDAYRTAGVIGLVATIVFGLVYSGRRREITHAAESGNK